MKSFGPNPPAALARTLHADAPRYSTYHGDVPHPNPPPPPPAKHKLDGAVNFGGGFAGNLQKSYFAR